MSVSRTRRRLLLAAGLSSLPAAALGSTVAAQRARGEDKARALAFEHTHTGEKLAITYAHGDAYVPAALQSLAWLLRDFRTGTTHPIDPALFDQLHALAGVTRSQAPFQVISGYRSPATNTMLRQHGGGVASHSLHLEGQAIDIRLADVQLAELRDAAVSLRAGGVGFYPGSDFVHVDTGRVRRW